MSIKMVVIQQDPDDEMEVIDQAVVFVDGEFDIEDLLDDNRITDVIPAPLITHVVTISSAGFQEAVSELGENRPYFG